MNATLQEWIRERDERRDEVIIAYVFAELMKLGVPDSKERAIEIVRQAAETWRIGAREDE